MNTLVQGRKSMLQEITIFALGVLVQSFITLRAVIDFKSTFIRIALAVGISLAAFLPGKHETHYDFSDHYTLSILFFMVVFSVMNNKKILPIITERFLLLFNMPFLYF